MSHRNVKSKIAIASEDLDPEKLTDRSKTPLAVVSTIEFTYSPGH
jgi:hypothetical protein